MNFIEVHAVSGVMVAHEVGELDFIDDVEDFVGVIGHDGEGVEFVELFWEEFIEKLEVGSFFVRVLQVVFLVVASPYFVCLVVVMATTSGIIFGTFF